MAGLIEKLISEAAKAELEAAIQKVSGLEAKILSLNDKLRAAAKAAPTGGGGNAGGGSTSTALSEEDRIRKQLATTQQKLELANTKLNKALIAEKETLRLVTAEIKAQVSSNNNLIGSYALADQELKKLQKDSQNLAFEMVKLKESSKGNTVEFRELEKRYIAVTNQANKLSGQLGAVDRSLGLGRRFVGNYENATRGLSNSINQVTREFPSFAFSAQTGFLAISNNLPILVDEINRLREANAALVKDGQKVPSLFGSILKSLFSWQTFLSISISALVIYGKEIGNLVSNLFSLREAYDPLIKVQEEFNEAIKTGRDNAQEQAQRVLTIAAALSNENTETQRKLELAKELRGIAPGLFQDLTDQEIATTNLTDRTDKLVKALVAKNKIDELNKVAAKNQIESTNNLEKAGQRALDLANERNKLEKEIANASVPLNAAEADILRTKKLRVEAIKSELALEIRKAKVIKEGDEEQKDDQLALADFIDRQLAAEEGIERARAEILKLENELTGVFGEQEEKTKKIAENIGKASPLISQDILDTQDLITATDALINAFSSLGNPDFTANLKRIKDLAELRLEFLFDPEGTLEKFRKKAEDTLKDLDDSFKDSVDTNRDLFNSLGEGIQLDALGRSIEDALQFGNLSDIKKLLSDVENEERASRDRRINELQAFLNERKDTIADASDEEKEEFTKVQNELNKLQEDKLKDRIKSIEDANNLILKLERDLAEQLVGFVNAVFDNKIEKIDAELNKLQDFFDEQLELAEGDAEQKKRIEKERRIQEKKLEKERLEAIQKQAIFNKAVNVAETIANTAASIVRVNKDIPFPFSIIVGSLYAAIGAAQLATIIAAPIPQFKDGVVGFEGGSAIVGDGGKREVITDSNLNPLFISPKTPTLVNLPKNSNVYKDENEYAKSLALNFRGSQAEKQMRLDALANGIDRGIKRGFKNARINNKVVVKVVQNNGFRL